MKLTLEQRKVKKMYIEGKTAKQIAKETGINISSIYRWIKDPKLEFKKSKELAEFSTEDMSTIVDESHKKLLIRIAENPDELLKPKTADALCKIAKVLESLDTKASREKALSLEEAAEAEVKGVLIIDDVEYRSLEKKAAEIEQSNN